MKLIELKNYPYYFASDDGNIYSKKGRGKSKDNYNNPIRCLSKGKSNNGDGYYQISLPNLKSKSGYRSQLVHRLIAEAFIKDIPKGMTVSHLDGNKYNNIPSNLKIESWSDNHARKKEHGTFDNGYNNSRALINKSQLKEIRKLLKERQMTHEEIGKLFGVNRVFISKISNGSRYKNQ